MPRSSKAANSNSVPTPTPDSEPPGDGANRRPAACSAKTKAAAAWQTLKATSKRHQRDTSAEPASEAPPTKRYKSVNNTNSPSRMPGTAVVEKVTPHSGKPPAWARRYAAPDIDVEHGDVSQVKSRSRSLASSNPSADSRHIPADSATTPGGAVQPLSQHINAAQIAKKSGGTEDSDVRMSDISHLELTEGDDSSSEHAEQQSDMDATSDEHHPGELSDSNEEELENDDPALIELERDAHALAHQFSQELVKWKAEPEDSQKADREDERQAQQQPPQPTGKSRRVRASIALSSGVSMKPEGDDSHVNGSIEIVWPGKGGKIGLKAQHSRVRAVAQQAINGLLARVCLENAFPEGPEKHNHFAKHALISSAEALGFDDIVWRLKSDKEYAKTLGTIRLSTFRGRIKAITDPLVQTAYGLECGARDHVNWLKDSLCYIYPGDFKASIPLHTLRLNLDP
ncbi:hypothetical protein BN946_scf184903.g12 [Trametes cinnabarina]|uniref:DUF6532 domain-containing protein n=1 Tax=Pycnoporus cinnabarinus TaxID=5643 RepID=A0A060SRW8_PYCCI|nr:hypothetical protein BN946_scf184903.g12 [Trametes cinnabarina]